MMLRFTLWVTMAYHRFLAWFLVTTAIATMGVGRAWNRLAMACMQRRSKHMFYVVTHNGEVKITPPSEVVVTQVTPERHARQRSSGNTRNR